MGDGITIPDLNNPQNTSTNQAARSWNDGNGNYVPDCDLLAPAANGECGPISDTNFGKPITTTKYDADILNGSGVRNYNWQYALGVQHELLPRVSLNVTYNRRSYGNFWVTDNLAISPSDYDPFCITAPVDARLPGGGGNQVCGLFDVRPAKFGQVNNLVTDAGNYGHISDVYNPRGIMIQGGLSTGREVFDNCDVVGKVENVAATLPYYVTTFSLPNLSGMASPSALYCHVSPPYMTQVKLQGVYPLPFWGLQASAALQSSRGPEITALYVAPNALALPTLGRNLAAGAAGTTSVQLIPPGTQYEGRLNQVDFRLSKSLRVGQLRVQPSMDVYNLLNASAVLALNTRYGASWLRPTGVLPGRFAKFGVLVDF
jgi:hypothetical protein